MIRIVSDWLRVEYGGASSTPAKIIVPIAFDKGSYSDIQVCVKPRSGIRLKQEVETGDAFTQTFTKGWTKQTGASFFGAVGVGHSTSVQSLPYSVAMTPDFQGVLFKISRLKVDVQIGIQIAFLIESYIPTPQVVNFAEVTLSLGSSEVAHHVLPEEAHPGAARMLLIDGLSKLNGSPTLMPQRELIPFISAKPTLEASSRDEVLSSIASGCDILHLAANVENRGLNFNGNYISPVDLFRAVDFGEVKLVYLSCCNSVEVVSHFRNSSAYALIAATQNLSDSYASRFENYFYECLSSGELVSASFDRARRKLEASAISYQLHSFRDAYNPMFLDLKRDISFRPVPS